jgi:hypothetical protein
VRHAGGFLGLAVVALIGLAAILGSSNDTTPGPGDAAPAAAVAAEQQREDATETATATPTATPRPVSARGADGRTYMCSYSVLDDVDAAKDRITRRQKILKARRAAVRRIERQYPSGRAPDAVVDRYDKLVARSNAQVDWTNKAVDQYNALLRKECDVN